MVILARKLGLLLCFALILGSFAPVVSSALVEGTDDTQRLEKIVIVHYKNGINKVNAAGGNKDSGSYKLFAKGAKWDSTPVNYVIDSRVPSYLTISFVRSALYASAEKWDSQTKGELFNNATKVVSDGTWDISSPDGRNELVFGNYPDGEVIAVTVIWGIFSGPIGQRRITEFDIMFDIDFTWGDATANFNLMDLRNIATHEFGHGAGLDDLYDPSSSEETMYGYSNIGEIKKRTLNSGDIAGIKALYGK